MCSGAFTTHAELYSFVNKNKFKQCIVEKSNSLINLKSIIRLLIIHLNECCTLHYLFKKTEKSQTTFALNPFFRANGKFLLLKKRIVYQYIAQTMFSFLMSAKMLPPPEIPF